MQQSARQVGALAPRGQSHTMPSSSAHWRLGTQLCRQFSQPLRHLSRSEPSQVAKSTSCSVRGPSSSHSSSTVPYQPAFAPQQAHSTALGASAAVRSGCSSLGSILSASQRALTSSGFSGLEPAAYSGQHGLRRSVRLKAISEKGHCGEDGLVKGAGVIFSENTGLKLQRRAYIVWDDDGPQRVLLVKKVDDQPASTMLEEIGKWLQARGLTVLVEHAVQQREFPQFEAFAPNASDVDFCVTLGGDGTVLHLTSLFSEDAPLPPLVSFAMGTLGFLTPFDVTEYASCLTQVLEAAEKPVFCTLRTRKRCELTGPDGAVQATHHVLNECLIDRGSAPSMVKTELFVDGHHITTVQADGLIIATPSGSTAYSMSAGGPMVAPSVPCTLLTPIAPHSLSFRPLVIPEASDVQIHIPQDSRASARVSFDGRNTCRMARGSVMKCSTSLCAVPFINLGPLDNDWYDGIVQKLKWNVSARELKKLPSLKKPAYEENGASWDSCSID